MWPFWQPSALAAFGEIGGLRLQNTLSLLAIIQSQEIAFLRRKNSMVWARTTDDEQARPYLKPSDEFVPRQERVNRAGEEMMQHPSSN